MGRPGFLGVSVDIPEGWLDKGHKWENKITRRGVIVVGSPRNGSGTGTVYFYTG